jgi:hypothetical protein
VAEWLGNGLQNHLQRFDSARNLSSYAEASEDRSLAKASEDRSLDKASEDRSLDKASEDRSLDKASEDRPALRSIPYGGQARLLEYSIRRTGPSSCEALAYPTKLR